MTWINLREEILDLFSEAETLGTERSEPDTHMALYTPSLVRRPRTAPLPAPRLCMYSRCCKMFTPKHNRAKFCKPEHRIAARDKAKRERGDVRYLHRRALQYQRRREREAAA